MVQQLNFNPERPKSTQSVVLGGVTYHIRTAWKDRLRGWYLDLRLADGTDIALGVRIAPGATVVPDVNRWDDTSEAGGVLLVVGKEPYAREDLGKPGGVNVIFATRAEFDTYISDISPAGLVLQVTP